MPSSSLGRLARSLAGGPPDPPPSPPEGRKPFSATPPPPPPPEAPTEPPLAVKSPFLPPKTRTGTSHARLLTHAGRTQSIRAWAATLGLDRRTLAYRLNHGWSVAEALGFAARIRDHAAEQARSLATQANTKVLIVDPDGSIIPRAEAAARLGIKLRSLTHRLRQYRPADGSNTQVPFSLLDRR